MTVGLLHGRLPDGAHCSRRAGLQQCKSFVEICIVSCLSALSVFVCSWGASTWGCPCHCTTCCREFMRTPLCPAPPTACPRERRVAIPVMPLPHSRYRDARTVVPPPGASPATLNSRDQKHGIPVPCFRSVTVTEAKGLYFQSS